MRRNKAILAILVLLAALGAATSWASNCVDSDHGYKLFDAGAVTDDANPNPVVDTCLDATTLVEAYCDHTDSLSTAQVECEFGCYQPEGACFKADDLCSDGDHGSVVTVRGLVKDKTQRFDSANLPRWDACTANGTNLLERSCDADGFLSTTTVACSAGCAGSVEDVCNIPDTATESCTDSDGGISEFTAGQVDYLDSQVQPTTKYDECIDEWNLRERVCNGNAKARNVNIRCEQGCSSGACNTSEPHRFLPASEIWDNGFQQACFHSAQSLNPDRTYFDVFNHYDDCESLVDGIPASRYWQVVFKSGPVPDHDANPPEPDYWKLAIDNGCVGIEVVEDAQGDFEGVRLIQDHSTQNPNYQQCNDQYDGLLQIQRKGYPEFPALDRMVTRVTLKMENDFESAIDNSGTRYGVKLKGRRHVAPTGSLPTVYDFVLGVTLSRDKPGNAGQFDHPCVVTARRCNENDACGGDDNDPDDNGHILHLYGTCFDAWLEPSQEKEIRIDWGEILEYAQTLVNSDGSYMFPPFESIDLDVVRIGMELKPPFDDPNHTGPGDPPKLGVRERRSELLIKDFEIYSKDPAP